MNELPNKLIDSIPSENLTNLTTECLEILLDENLQDGVLKEIPVFGSLIKFYKAYKGTTEWFFIRKLSNFLYKLSDIPIDKRNKFWEKYEANPEDKQDLGDKLINLIEKLDDLKRCDLLANSFKSLIFEQINKNQFYDLIYVIERLKLHTTWDFILLSRRGIDNITQEQKDHFFNCGLLRSRERFSYSRGRRVGSNYEISQIGKDFIQFSLHIEEFNLKDKYIDAILKMPITFPRGVGLHQITEMTKVETKAYFANMDIEKIWKTNLSNDQVIFAENRDLRLRRVEENKFHLITINTGKKENLE